MAKKKGKPHKENTIFHEKRLDKAGEKLYDTSVL